MDTKSKTSKRYPTEVRERAVRLARAALKSQESEWAAIRFIAGKIGCTTDPPGDLARPWVQRRKVEMRQRDHFHNRRDVRDLRDLCGVVGGVGCACRFGPETVRTESVRTRILLQIQ